jgi:hypothetical protein
MKNMKRNGLFGKLGVGLVSLALAGGCAHRSHSPFFAETRYNPATGAVDLNVSDEAGIRRVEIYRGDKRIGRYDLGKFGNPTSHLIQTGISQDGDYFFKIFGDNGETDVGGFRKIGEKVSPERQGCL